MKRRALLACALPAAIAGCTGDALPGRDEEPGGGESESGGGSDESDAESNETSGSGDDGAEAGYTVGVEAPVSDPGDSVVCEFESLPDAAREEFEAAIDGVDFETDDRGYYSSESSPALLDTDCYNAYVAYEGEYYWVSVDAVGG
ncbi:hypothetical protein EXE43_22575 [Halorubrum sp. SS5]|uniref:hypothetical protein n=1 Tax=Halorubrum sp. SS7 TaxID=2518119 RepID=UPI0010F666AA|nr:hypothetical protein [Halorubrum sp. SS7]TKX56259.1 hypothetical protein EXE44_15770 [Halorubrum sp. SS7]TKX83759.1 hypothetical protein EXE43_22575 [Halorubrum sp. SS5]